VDADVIVVGASVAGAATALHLARAGHHVLVLDRSEFPRDKPCGEGLLPHGARALDALGIAGITGHPFHGIAYHAGGIVATGRFPAGSRGLAIRRLALDAALVAELRRTPKIEVRTGVRVDGVTTDTHRATASTATGNVTARALVGADGLLSGVRKHLGLATPAAGDPRYGARVHVRAAPRDVVDVHIGGSADFYATPLPDGEANVAILCGKDVTREFGGDLLGGMRRVAASNPEIARLLASEVLSEPRLTGPLRQTARDVVADRAVLVGDAAGFVDAITGEGMSLALASAKLAADTLGEALRTDRLGASDLRGYARARAALARDVLRLTEVVLFGLRKPWLARRIVRNLARHPATFDRFLAVAAGERPLRELRARDWVRIAV
jgi:flavin-dependent dehydrogenase